MVHAGAGCYEERLERACYKAIKETILEEEKSENEADSFLVRSIMVCFIFATYSNFSIYF